MTTDLIIVNKYYENKIRLYTKLGITQCAICGYPHPLLLDMHHILPKEKRAKVSSLISAHKMKEAYEEALNCAPLCGKCHREADQGFWSSSFLSHITIYKEDILVNKKL